MTGRKRAADLVAEVSTRPAAGTGTRRDNLKALLGTEDGTYQLVDAKVLPIARIARNPNQPRQTFDEETLRELANSIAARGILQPLRVRRHGDDYQIVAGERRFRAAQLVGLTEVPAIVVDQEEDQAYLDSLIENIQREDLNPLDRAEALRQLRLNLGSVSWKEVGAAIGLSERSVFHLLNLSTLPEEIQRDVRSGELTGKHGRALHRLRQDPNLQHRAYEEIVARRLSGDEALRLAQTLRAEAAPHRHPDHASPLRSAETDRIKGTPEEAMTQLLSAVALVEGTIGDGLSHRRRALVADLEQVEQRLRDLRCQLDG